ncbi:hypothetical protein LIER_29093 [Lithospermum erythrorhizon]|uniref:Uncharacterized protein n=1 Tax=Lithospermum erythrorhizon TaxID=34254 RepID=A0AAV3RL25_LITER
MPPQTGILVNQKHPVNLTTLYLQWKDDVGQEEPNRGHDDQIQHEQSVVGAEGSMHVPPIVADTNKIVSRINIDMVDDANHPGEKDVGGNKVFVPEKVSGNNEFINPSVKDTMDKTSNESAKIHSFVDPTVAEILGGMKEVKVGTARVVIYYTASKTRKRTWASVVALEKKRIALGTGGVVVVTSEEQKESVDVEELDKKVEKLRAAKKGKEKAKRPSGDKDGGSVPKKKRKEDVAEILKQRSKEKLKKNDNRNKVYNRRIAKDVPNVPIEGVDFNSEEHEARWKFICASNILPEKYLFEITYNNQTYIAILEDASPMLHQVKLRGHIFNFRPELINNHYGKTNDRITGATLKLADIMGYLLINQYREVLKVEDGLGEDAKSLTISDKLMIVKHVVDVSLNAAEQTEVVPKGEVVAMLINAFEEEQQRLEVEIQVKKVKVTELQAKIQSLKAIVPPAVNDHVTTSTVVPAEPTPDDVETFKSPM